MKRSDDERAKVERRLEHLTATAKEAGVKLTPQRLEIFRELTASVTHPDAETIFRAVQRRMPTVSLDTVYRTLWRLEELGLVATLGPPTDAVRFDANLERHHHYVCVRCGLVRDFESAGLDALRVPESVKALGSVVGARVEVRGLCAACQRAAAPRDERKQPKKRERNEP
jgi:Fur family peroxide stress response transcriptional regulator